MIEIIEIITRIIAMIFAVIGIFFFIVGTTGILRLPDFYCRTHAATKCDTLGACSILLGLAIYERFSFDALKILVLFALVLISSPTMGHAIARASFRRGLQPWRKVAPPPLIEEKKEAKAE
ncbi:MAG: monovalent cation/H(+) antiporter subunit G [Actinomycetota bacterium]|nr:monovalent cation/H(+) antiporter subunit G [Actinomycetota bacterium]